MIYDVAFTQLAQIEGGYVNHEDDPGGETNFGISKSAFPLEDIPGMTLDRAKFLYKRDYWGPAGCDALPDKVKYAQFDCAVHSGPRRAIKLLQQAVGAVPDGYLGPKTLQAVNSMSPARAVARMVATRQEFMVSLPTWRSFSRGWVRRMNIILLMV